MKEYSIGLKTKILTLIFVFILTSAMILTYSTYSKLKNDIHLKNEEIFNTFTSIFYSEKDIIIKKYSMSLDILFENIPLMEAFRNRDRKRVETIVLELYNTKLKHLYDIAQFQFHTPPATSFYRAHAPQNYDDDLSSFRNTIIQAEKSKNMVTGLELGRGGLGLRVVKPAWFNYDFIGTVELGGNIENLLTTPSHATGVDYAVGVFVKSLQKSRFLYEDSERFTHKDMYMYNYSSNTIRSLVTKGYTDPANELVEYDSRYYMVRYVPLKDFSSEQIGYLILSRDTTNEIAAMHKELFKQGTIIFAYTVVILGFLSAVLINLIFSPLEKITRHISSIDKNGEISIPENPVEITGSSEISLLADAFNLLTVKLAESFDKINNHVKEIEDMNISLEERVHDRTNQLETANTKLRNAMEKIRFADEAKSEFLANMSHEIKTPMNAVLGLCYLLMQTELTSKQYDYVSKVRNSVNMLLEILTDVLDLSKIEAGKLELDIQPFNLKESLEKITGILEISLSKKDIELIRDIDPAIPDYLMGDSLRIAQVVNNLGTNSVNYTEKGHICISAKLLTKNDNYAKIRISVKDTGIGIPADKLNILFDSFTQIKRDTNKKYAGSGLGLSISKKILEAMNSDIQVESREGEGSEFCFTLTLHIADSKDVAEAASTDARYSGKRILICEKNRDRAYSVTGFFRENMADVLAVSNQFDLLKHINNNADCGRNVTFDLVIIDEKTADKKIFDTLSDMSARFEKCKFPPVVYISDSTQTDKLTQNHSSIDLFILHTADVWEKLPELAKELLNISSDIKPDVECFRRNRQYGTALKALLVDDNDLNLQVITEFADILGMEYKTARNGREAVDAVAAEDFDVVLMDIIMPEMDGITATKNIRKNPKHKHLPIYALSASTMPEDIKKCREAGMNGHLSKPLKLQDLTAAINECVRHRSLSEDKNNKELGLPFSDELIDTETALEYLNGNKRLYLDLLKKYHSVYGGLGEKSEEVVSTGDHEKIKNYFHTIKGVARTIGAVPLSNLAEELEIMAYRQTPVEKSEQYKQFKQTADAMDKKLAEHFTSA
jgi:signal transduction histidine kinase/DNA-binding response OmpR family regulator